ncbi:MAG: translation initiation factor IF-6 [Thermoplasmata archaeon]|nr:translation initiation factor IF-6 [Thermoplasmata archaeon]MCI4358925.1 translation initiation factor IF-6 [Thermoplasmata archaeon]
MPVGRALIGGSPYIGVYVRPSDAGALVAHTASLEIVREVERLLKVPCVRTSLLDSELVGTLVAINSHGAVVGEEIDDKERTAIERITPVHPIRSRYNATGNNVLANDSGAIVHPDFSDDAIERIGRALRVSARRGTVAGLGTVGMAAVATNRGLVVHPRATDREVEVLTETLHVPVHRSTANFGVPIVGACLAANSRAVIVGKPTTPVEIVHLQEGLGILD